jgi:hypothetical protein
MISEVHPKHTKRKGAICMGFRAVTNVENDKMKKEMSEKYKEGFKCQCGKNVQIGDIFENTSKGTVCIDCYCKLIAKR